MITRTLLYMAIRVKLTSNTNNSNWISVIRAQEKQYIAHLKATNVYWQRSGEY